MELLFLFTSLQNIVILSIIIIVRAGVKSTNVVCPHNGTYNLCIFLIFFKTGLVDIVPLCCKPSICSYITTFTNVICDVCREERCADSTRHHGASTHRAVVAVSQHALPRGVAESWRLCADPSSAPLRTAWPRSASLMWCSRRYSTAPLRSLRGLPVVWLHRRLCAVEEERRLQGVRKTAS